MSTKAFAGEADETWIFWKIPIAKNNTGDEFERQTDKVERERSKDCERTSKRSKKEWPHKRKKD